MSKNQQINYTTKPIKLPLSTEKEYVLVDVEGYLKSKNQACNRGIMKEKDLTRPFKLSSIDCFGDGVIDGIRLAVIEESSETDLFSEVIRQPQTNEFNTDSIAVTEQEEGEFNAMANSSEIPNSSGWDGAVLPPVGVECELKYRHSTHAIWMKCKVFSYSNEYGDVAAVWHYNDGVWCHGTIDVSDYEFRKPETPEKKAERERLEAAYDLYCEWYQTIWLDIIGTSSIEDFIHDELVCKSWLAIVDKTNYRLNK